MEEILAATAALALLEKLIPLIDARVQKGEISVNYQRTLLDRKDALQATLDERLSAPHWQIER